MLKAKNKTSKMCENNAEKSNFVTKHHGKVMKRNYWMFVDVAALT